MKITLEQIAPYLPHKVGYINTATGQKGTVNTTNLHLFFMNEDLKIILKPMTSDKVKSLGMSKYFNMDCYTPMALMELTSESCGVISGSWSDYQILLSNHYDFNSLIDQGVAVAINTTI